MEILLESLTETVLMRGTPYAFTEKEEKFSLNYLQNPSFSGALIK